MHFPHRLDRLHFAIILSCSGFAAGCPANDEAPTAPIDAGEIASEDSQVRVMADEAKDAGGPAQGLVDAPRQDAGQDLYDCDGGFRAGEFGEDCVWPVEETDAAPVDAETLQDSSLPDTSVAPLEDAAVQVDAASPADDASTPICGDMPYECSNELMRPIQAGASCTFGWGNSIDVVFSACEDCSTIRTTYSPGLVFRDCGGCEQRYATRGGLGMPSLSNGACTSVRYRATNGLDNTALAGESCVDVYASTQSTIVANAQGATYRPEQLAHVCRCDTNARTCTPCAAGGCADVSAP